MRIRTHPGEVLREEFVEPLELNANKLALALRVPSNRINSIMKEERGVSPDTAMRLARFFGTSAEFWMNLQSAYDLSKTQVEQAEAIEREVEEYAEARYA